MTENCTEWLELGPPPDRILTLPPPPLPSFLQVTTNNLSASPCSGFCQTSGNSNSNGVQFVELSPHGLDGELDDTWLFVLISCSVGVLLLGSMLALLLLKCREERNCKTAPSSRIETTTTTNNTSIVVTTTTITKKPQCEAVIYPSPTPPSQPTSQEDSNRVLWATLTPRGTAASTLTSQNNHHLHNHHHNHSNLSTFENTGFSESDVRPRVSSPTRIEHPNLPPLNLPAHRTLKRQHPPVL